jgi:hypothetical protein
MSLKNLPEMSLKFFKINWNNFSVLAELIQRPSHLPSGKINSLPPFGGLVQYGNGANQKRRPETKKWPRMVPIKVTTGSLLYHIVRNWSNALHETSIEEFQGGCKSGCKVLSSDLEARHVVPLEPALTRTLTQDSYDGGLRFQCELPIPMSLVIS